MKLKSQVLDEWFKSLKFDPTVEKDSNNVELIDIKVAPISDLILDHSVAVLYNLLVGKHIAYETEVLPRARNQIFAKIPTSTLRVYDRAVTNQVVCGHEIIGEVLNEHVHNVEYTVFYPTLGGKMGREGLGRRCSDDSLFTITWKYLDGHEKDAKAYVRPLVRLNYDDYIYYNNGDIDISPSDSLQSYTSDISVRQAAVYMWNDTCVSNMKVGPYYLHQGVMANTSKDKSAMNTIRTLLKDIPVGYQLADTAKVNEIVRFMYHSGEVFAADRIKHNDVPSFFSYKRFILFDNNTNQYGIFRLEPHDDAVLPMKLENIGQALLLRRRDFQHM